MKQEIQEKLLEFVSRNFMVDREEIDPTKSLIDEGIIDSFGLVEIAVFMETEFSMTVAEEEMIRPNFGSVLKMVDFIHGQASNE